MKKSRDLNEIASRIVAKSTGAQPGGKATPRALEAAWREWSKQIQNVDQRTLTLLRAAFEAGYDLGRMSQS